MKKKNKTPLPLKLIQWTFPKVERVAPSLAGSWFVNLFFTPLKNPYKESDMELLDQAETFQITYKGKKVSVYEWGSGKPVLLVHGWMGKVTQFSKMVSSLNELGFKAVSFDAPAHGNSEGKQTNLIEFSEIIQKLFKIYNGFEMIVAHSIGGVASLNAVLELQQIDKLVMISSPSMADEILLQFRKGMNASEKMIPYLLDYVKEQVGVEFKELAVSEQIKKLANVQLLLIHDEDDQQVSVDNSKLTKECYPNANLILTEGLGHNRILKDEKVVSDILNHLQSQNVLNVGV